MFERAKKVFERNIKCLSRPQKFLSRPEKYLSAMRKCWQVNLNVFGDINFIKKFLRYKILNLKCRRNFYPLGQAYLGGLVSASLTFVQFLGRNRLTLRSRCVSFQGGHYSSRHEMVNRNSKLRAPVIITIWGGWACAAPSLEALTSS